MSELLLATGFGLVVASVLALSAVGLSLQFGITNYINFAYGDFMAVGAYVAWTLNTGPLHANIWVAMLAGGLSVGILAVLLNRFLLAPFARRFQKLFYILIVTFGLSLILLNLVSSIWGTEVLHYDVSNQTPFHVGPFLFTTDQLVVIFIALVVMVLIHLMLTMTRLGKSMRAMSDNSTLAMTSGVDTKRITTLTWFMSGVLAGIGGTILGLTQASITPGSGETFLFVIFAAVIVGGVGSIYGAMVGAVIVGLATELSALVIDPSYKLDVAFVVLILALLFRPNGLFARPGKA
ncbi:branched-chain amino acid ABC transporter permease [Diaminobutyricibacter tongyongensis]|uniref:Branched-chain amino acid ABC transporter permease n=1 Tax=Leifsonia tongyongensis TaxID=1268043 RepID=A0A6L9XTK8_9MICO|nr:branched-chain amino acid ABC transporter permease [Diaminobutyricibacter tongyongensis]NEN04703.1 branched-chain amino acid ABC transporter permease [Diaminobutyricibacter tongyongensis]